ncbi:hypothetical protein D3C87_1019980 [compost metagenome]
MTPCLPQPRQREVAVDLRGLLVEAQRGAVVALQVALLAQCEGTQCIHVGGGDLRQRHGIALDRGGLFAELVAQVQRDLVHRRQHGATVGEGGAHRQCVLGARVHHLHREPHPSAHVGHRRQQHQVGAGAERDHGGIAAVQRAAAHAPAHHLQGAFDAVLADHVDVPGLFQADPEGLVQRVIQDGVVGEVAQVADDHPIAFGEGDRRRWPQQHPAAGHQHRHHRQLGGQGRRLPPQRDVAPGLGVAAGHAQGGEADLAHFEHFLAGGHALEAPAAMRFPQQARGAVTELAAGAVGQRFGHRRHQDLPRPGQGHQPGCHRLGQALDLQRLGAHPDRLGAVLPGQHFTHVQAGAGAQHDATFLAQPLQPALVVQRETQRVDRAFEQQEQAVGAVDLVPVPLLLQCQHQAVVLLEQLGRGRVTDAFDQDQRIAQVGEQQRPHLRDLGRRSVVAVHADLPPIRAWRSPHATSAAGCRPGAWPGTARCRRERTTRSTRCGVRAGARRC